MPTCAQTPTAFLAQVCLCSIEQAALQSRIAAASQPAANAILQTCTLELEACTFLHYPERMRRTHTSSCRVPDRYGPFWVATTLIFTSTVSGNYANYLSYKRDEAAAAGAAGAPSPSAAAAPAGDQKVWYYDINKVRRS